VLLCHCGQREGPEGEKFKKGKRNKTKARYERWVTGDEWFLKVL